MDLRRLADDLIDAIAEAEELAARLIWESLEPLIRRAWAAAVNPRVITASVDDTALRRISTDWAPPPEVGQLITDLHLEGAETALLGFTAKRTPGQMRSEVFTGLNTPVYDEAAKAYLATATNRLAGIGDSAWATAREQLVGYMGSPQTREDAKRGLEETLRVSEFRADTIARTEMGMAANAGVQYSADTLTAIGFAVRKQWFAQHDPRTRESHTRADGQEVPADGHFTVGGYELSRPGDPLGPAAEVINCRCTMLLVGDPTAAPQSATDQPDEFSPEALAQTFADPAARRTDPDAGPSDAALAAEAHLRRVGKEIDDAVMARLGPGLDKQAARLELDRVGGEMQAAFERGANELARKAGYADWADWHANSNFTLDQLRARVARRYPEYARLRVEWDAAWERSLGGGRAPGDYLRALRDELEARGVQMGRASRVKTSTFEARSGATKPIGKDYADVADEVMGLYPRSWNDHSDRRFADPNARSGGLHIGPVEKGNTRGWEWSAGDGSYVTVHIPSSRKDDRGLYVHELGHMFEDHVPGVKGAEWTFRTRRAMERGGLEPKRMSWLTGNQSYADHEVAVDGGFAEPYMGKVYGGPAVNAEVLSMGMEGLYRGQWGMLDSDADYRHFIVGLLATLA